MALAARDNMHVRQFDVTTAYLNGVVDEEIFMEVPEYTMDALKSIVKSNRSPAIMEKAINMIQKLSKGGKVCLIKKALYGLRQAGRCWNKRLDQELRSIGATPSVCDPSVYQMGQGDSLLIIVVYVDDIVVVSRSSKEIVNFGISLKKVFDIRDLGEVKHCLGMEFTRNEAGIKISQGAYVRDILKRFGMEDCHAVSTPIAPGTKLSKSDTWTDADGPKPAYRELTGALMYLSVATRPDISHTTSVLCQFNDSFGKSHWRAAKRVLRYLKGTQDVGIFFGLDRGQLLGFADADWGACPDDRRSFTGYAFTIGGGVISWESRKQRTVALSTTEAEYMALSDATKEAIYLKRFLHEMGECGSEVVTLFMDNAGAVKLATNPVFHSRTKHIDIRHHFVRDAVNTEDIRLEYLPTEDMPADVLTKGLPRIKHWRCLESLGIKKPSPKSGARFEGDC